MFVCRNVGIKKLGAPIHEKKNFDIAQVKHGTVLLTALMAPPRAEHQHAVITVLELDGGCTYFDSIDSKPCWIVLLIPEIEIKLSLCDSDVSKSPREAR